MVLKNTFFSTNQQEKTTGRESTRGNAYLVNLSIRAAPLATGISRHAAR